MPNELFSVFVLIFFVEIEFCEMDLVGWWVANWRSISVVLRADDDEVLLAVVYARLFSGMVSSSESLAISFV